MWALFWRGHQDHKAIWSSGQGVLSRGEREYGRAAHLAKGRHFRVLGSWEDILDWLELPTEGFQIPGGELCLCMSAGVHGQKLVKHHHPQVHEVPPRTDTGAPSHHPRKLGWFRATTGVQLVQQQLLTVLPARHQWAEAKRPSNLQRNPNGHRLFQ